MFNLFGGLFTKALLVEEAGTTVMENLTEIAENEDIDVGLLQQFFQELPEKAFQLGVKVVIAIILSVIAWEIINFIGKVVNKSLVKMSLGKVDKSLAKFLTSLVKVVLRVLLVFAIIAGFGVDTASIIAILGSAGVAIGLAVQGTLSNFAGGVLILLSKPFEVGDYIVVSSGYEGTVLEISLINTKLSTVDNRVIIIPNGGLADSAIINNTFRDERVLDVKVGVAYDSDIKKVKEVLFSTLDKSSYIMKDADKLVFVDELGDSSIVMCVRSYVPANVYFKAKWEMNELIKNSLDEAGINIPFPQVDVHMIPAK